MIKMKQLISYICLLIILALPTVQAEIDPETLVRETVDKMVTTIRANKAEFEKNPAQLFKLVDEIVLPNFDFGRMSKLVLAKYWRTATDEQKSRFTAAFRALIVRTYALSLLEYTDEEINFLPMTGDLKKRKVTVRTEVTKPGNSSGIPINYFMYLPKDAWKVYDVKVDAVSLVINYKKTYGSSIKKNGLDKLISDLEAKNIESQTASE
jgi:phospholipid transport system substrate-binding protein